MCPIGARSVFTSHETAFTAAQTNFMIESSTGLSRDEFDGLRAELAWRLVETAALGRPRSGRGGSRDQPPGQFGEKSIKLIERQSCT